MGVPVDRPLQASPVTRAAAAALIDFRAGLHRCFGRWADAGFELCEAVLCAPGPISSVPALSLEPCFRRSHGSLYKALHHGHLQADTRTRD